MMGRVGVYRNKLHAMEVLFCLLLILSVCAPVQRCLEHDSALLSTTTTKQPVIIDTDIGSFIDDSFAIVFAAQSQFLDIKLVVTCSDGTTDRAKVAAKLLRMMGREDIPIGVGIENGNQTQHTLFDWASSEDLSSYKGGVFTDGVSKMGEIIMSSEQVVDIIAIGPMTNFPTLLKKYPGVVRNARVRAMAGSVYMGYHGDIIPVAEFNVKICPSCMEMLLQAGWNVTITPLDTCGQFTLNSDELKQIFQVDNPVSRALGSTLLYFCITNTFSYDTCNLPVGTPVIYDAIATLLAMPKVGETFIVYSEMSLKVNGSGFTVLDDKMGTPTSVALHWKQQGEEGFADMLTKLFCMESARAKFVL